MQKPHKATRTFARFEWGLPSIPRLGIWDGFQDINFRGVLYLAEPAAEFEIAEKTGNFDDEPSIIKLPNNSINSAVTNFLDGINSGQPYPRIDVNIFELIDNDEIRGLDFGVLAEAEGSPYSNLPLTELHVVDPIEALGSAPLNLATTPECQNAYCGAGCFKPLTTYDAATNNAVAPEAIQIPVRVTFVNGFRVTVEAADGNPASNTWIQNQIDGWWERGSLELNGLSITIRSWARFTRDFILADWLSPEWNVGSTEVMLVPGCQKTPAACLERNNLSAFNGYGWPTPAWNPVLSIGNR